jgi:ubiquinone/menaquinone biosynthesis C-methylase UbiE
MNFKDYFSRRASDYTKYRPHYPAALFKYLASLSVNHEKAWDCATGNGQAALGLIPFFEHIVATDASEKQVANATKHRKITYIVAPAEKTGIESTSIDLLVVAQALHWFDRDKFYAEAKKVLKPGGVIAAWSYSLLRIAPAIDSLIDKFYTDIIGPFWPPERKWVEDNYSSIPFPFQEISAPRFNMKATWDLKYLVGYLGTWSAVQRFKEKNKMDPIENLIEELVQAWGQPETEKQIYWPINMRVGRIKNP